MFWKLSSALVITLLAILIHLFLEDKLFTPGELPDLPDTCWTDACDKREQLEPFKISVSDAELADLKSRIGSDLKKIVKPLNDIGFEYGFNSEYLKEIAKYWNDSYKWRQQETFINNVPQFTTRIDGLDIHFLHAKPKSESGKKIVPLLLVHGWPGSFVEFLDIIPLLTAGNSELAFEVVAPSIPGYGFSSAPQKPGHNAAHTAKIFRDLMLRLGHSEFYCQGGDWGALVTTNLATFFPDNVRGLHVNMAGAFTNGGMAKSYLARIPGLKYLIADPEDFDKVPDFGFLLQESGYMHLQATKPDTVGVGLSSSPLGLAAYIMEKFSTWTDPAWRELQDGGLETKTAMDKDRMLTNVMIYWITNSITSSMRYYKENLSSYDMAVANTPVRVPVGFADLPHELTRVPRHQLTGKFPRLVSLTTLPSGGHFAAMEVPGDLAADVLTFASKVEKMK